MSCIGIFGGSFDPVHLEHIKIINVIFDEFNVDKIIVVPAYKPPHKKFLNVSCEHRINMLELALRKLKNVFIDTFEIDCKRTVYTYETLDYLQEKYSNAKLKLIIGADSFSNLDHWKKSEYIAKKYGFLVVNRENTQIDENSIFFQYSKFTSFKGKISSTNVRKNIKLGVDISCWIDYKVLNYIKENELYK